ncbi:MAG: choice-of-anchor J domain-containing protein [Bacteroidales bacterium]|jgi:hypothetical protein|nr:choice-of-anchor J domain-containing protein [Bacteroidales bacterium]MCK9449932.1 choice-of-anchor J domain-containing protein [Bacteroidales bacterium]MDD3702561.1 choice-of-anchor J domain-containing protein [Bacteroidales bacterium]
MKYLNIALLLLLGAVLFPFASSLAQITGLPNTAVNHLDSYPLGGLSSSDGIRSYTERTLVGLDTQFGGDALPEGWQMNELGEEGYSWELLPNMIWINSYQNEGHHVAGELISPVIDCSEMEVVLLGMNLYYYFYPFPAGMTDAEIRYSTDGITWHTFYTFTHHVGQGSNSYNEWDLTEVAAGEDTFYLKFWFDDQDELRAYWQIKMVTVYAPTEPEFSIIPDLTSQDFGTVLLNESSLPQTFTIFNSGIGSLLVQPPVLDNSTHFSILYEPADFPALLGFHDSVSFEAVFHPQLDGILETDLILSYTEAAPGQHSITLTGTGFDPTVTEFPWMEGFNQFDFPALGWHFVGGVDGAYWEGNGVEKYEGSRSVRARYGPTSAYKANEWLVSPPLDLDQPNAELLYFFVMSNFEPDSITDKLQVWILPDYFDDVAKLEANGEMIAEVYAGEAWERKSVDIRGYSGIKHIAFRYWVNHTSGWRLVYLDAVTIDKLETYSLTMLEPYGEEGKVVPQPGYHTYFEDEQITLTADADYAWGWKFDKWEVDGEFYSDQPQATLVMDANKTAQAYFVPVTPITLEMIAAQGGSSLPATGLHQYKQGTQLSVMAYPESGYQFNHWKKNGLQYSINNPILISIDEDLSLQAVFSESSSYTIGFTVKDSQGNNITTAQIRMNGIENPTGNYFFDGLFPGSFHYSVIADGFIPTGGEIELTNQNISHEIILAPVQGDTFTVTFTITDEAGLSIDDALITLNGYEGLEGMTNFTGFSAGSYPYKVAHSGFQSVEQELQIVSEDVFITVMLTADNRFWYEDFEQHIQPGGWGIVIHGDDNRGWEFTDGTASIHPNENLNVSASLISPAIAVNDANALSISMHHFYNPYTRTNGAIRISNDGLTWHTAQTFRDKEEGDLFMEDMMTYYLTEHFDFNDKIYLSFYYSALNSYNNFYNWTIDDLELFKPDPQSFEASQYSNNIYLHSGQTGIHQLFIKNTGGLTDTYTLEKIDGSWDYDFPSELTLNGGNQMIIDLSFVMPNDLDMGTRDTLVIRISSLGNPQLTHDISFISATIAPIKAYYKEDFDIVTVPELPGGWTRIVNSTTNNARLVTVKNADAASVPNHIRSNNSSDPEAELILIAPPLAEGKSLKEFRTRLMLKNSTSAPLILGTMDDPQGTFTPITSWVSDNHYTWKEMMHGFEDYEGTDTYVAFKHDVTSTYTQEDIDDIIIEVIPPPIFYIDTPSHDFGEGWVDYNNDSIEVVITNKGHYELLLQEIVLEAGENFWIKANNLPVALEFNEPYVFKVGFNPQQLGQVQDHILITYTEETQHSFSMEINGQGLVRPQGSTCDDPVVVDLPLINYEGNTQQYGRDFRPTFVVPENVYLSGNEMVMQFTLEENSFLSGSVDGPRAGFFVLAACPDPINPPQILAGAFNIEGYDSFENVMMDAGTYYLIVSSSHTKPPFYTDFSINLSAEPMPDFHHVNFLVTEQSPEALPLQDARIVVEGEYISTTLYTSPTGMATASLLEGDYLATIFLFGYLEKEVPFSLISNLDLSIQLQDLMFVPSNLVVDTTGLQAGQALFSWDAKPKGEPWTQGFEAEFLPQGWDQIITNTGGLIPGVDSADWKFTWQQYGTIYFSDQTVVPKEGSKQAFVHWSTDPQDEWLISHEFKAPADKLVFWYFGNNGESLQHFYLKVSTDNGQSWTALWDASELPSGKNKYDYPAIVDLSYYADQQIRLAWNAVGNYGLISAFMLDDISVGDLRINTDDLIAVSKSGNTFMQSTSKEWVSGQPQSIASMREPYELPQVSLDDMRYTHDQKANRTMTGFDIYLDDMGTPIASGIQIDEYLYTGLAAGDYLAGVRAHYTTGATEIITKEFTIVKGTVGIAEQGGEEDQLKVFPNPANQWIMVENNRIIDYYSIFNSNGTRLIAGKAETTNLQLDVSSLTSGVYLLQIYCGKDLYHKLIQIY